MVSREDREFKCQKLHCNATTLAPFIFVFCVAGKNVRDRACVAYHIAHTTIMMKSLLAANAPATILTAFYHYF